MTTFLTQDQIMKTAPSVFTRDGYHKTSADYAPISTYEVLQGLFDLGFGVTKAVQVRTRNQDRQGYGKHMVRLRRYGEEMSEGQVPEIVLINSHDGSTSYQMKCGIYRLVCSNGLVVGNDYFSHKVRHEGDVVTRVAKAGGEIIEVFPQVMEKAEDWSKIQLNDNMKIALADSAKMLRWDSDNFEVETRDILAPRRYADQKNDLWTTFNVLQENLTKGGVYVRNPETRERRKSKAVTSPHENTKLNQALWQLTEKMASLAG